MNKHLMKSELGREFARNMAVMESLPDDLEFDFFSLGSVFMKSSTYDENLKTLHLFREKCGIYKLNNYYMSSDSCLAVVYRFNNFDLVLFNNDAEIALNSISGNKCKITTETKITPKVVCELEAVS